MKTSRLALQLSMMMRMTVAMTLVLASVATAQSGEPLDAAERQQVVEKISELLVDQYVFPDIAELCQADLLERLNAGEFDSVSDPEAFAVLLTEKVQAISNDKHMRVRVRQPRTNDDAPVAQPSPARQITEQRDAARRDNFGFRSVERLEGNIGYIDFRYFAGQPEARETAAAAMRFLANTDALIVDLRKNGGGNPGMVRFICSYFFDEPTHLNSLYWRAGDRTEEFWTLDELPGPRLAEVPIFVLTSNYTFSGAEEFCSNLQNRKRATIVGENTGGGANPGGAMMANERFSIFVPTGRAINPVTGGNWEGVGIVPDVETTADDAFDVAVDLAESAAEKRREQLSKNMNSTWSDFDASLQRVDELVESERTKEAAKMITTVIDDALASGLLSEMLVNQMGYQRLENSQIELAIAVFQVNATRFPESANVHDSLGEAFMNDGQIERAIRSYRESLRLDPDNENAKSMIQKMQSEQPTSQ